MNIESKKRNRLKEFVHHLHNKAEDTMFSIIQKLPDRLLPSFLMDWLNLYTTKRIRELKQQTVKQAWRKVSLEKVVDDISTRQQDTKKAPTGNE